MTSDTSRNAVAGIERNRFIGKDVDYLYSPLSGLAEGLQGDIVSLNGYATISSLNVGFDVAESLGCRSIAEQLQPVPERRLRDNA